MRIIFFAFIALSLSACMPGVEEVKPGRNSTAPIQDVTDYSICNGYASGNINGNWISRQKQGDVTITKLLKIGDSKISLTTECSVAGRTLNIEVSSWINYLNQAINVQSSVYETQSVANNLFDMVCESRINGGTVNYSFKGRCLVFSNPDNKNDISTWLPR